MVETSSELQAVFCLLCQSHTWEFHLHDIISSQQHSPPPNIITEELGFQHGFAGSTKFSLLQTLLLRQTYENWNGNSYCLRNWTEGQVLQSRPNQGRIVMCMKSYQCEMLLLFSIMTLDDFSSNQTIQLTKFFLCKEKNLKKELWPILIVFCMCLCRRRESSDDLSTVHFKVIIFCIEDLMPKVWICMSICSHCT